MTTLQPILTSHSEAAQRQRSAETRGPEVKGVSLPPINASLLRRILLARWSTLQDAVKAAELDGIRNLKIDDVRRLCLTAMEADTDLVKEFTVFLSDHDMRENHTNLLQHVLTTGAIALFEDLYRLQQCQQQQYRKHDITPSRAIAKSASSRSLPERGCADTKAKADHEGNQKAIEQAAGEDIPDVSSSPSPPTVALRAVLFALAHSAPREGFRAWSSRMMLYGVSMFGNLCQLLGPNARAGSGKGPITVEDFCEIVALLNGNIDDATTWFRVVQAESAPSSVGNSYHSRLSPNSNNLSSLSKGGSSPSKTRGRGSVMSDKNNGLKHSPSCVSQRAVPEEMDYGAILARAVTYPRLPGAFDAAEPLTLEETVIRLIYMWGDLTAAFGLVPAPKEDVSLSDTSTICSNQSSSRMAPVRSAPRAPRARILEAQQGLPVKNGGTHEAANKQGSRVGCAWRPKKQQWLRALRGKPGWHLLMEGDARAAADRFCSLAESVQPLFPTLSDRLLITKSKWCVNECITIRYMLTDSGFWGQGGPAPVEIAGSGVNRRLMLGAAPFIAALPEGADAAAGGDEPCLEGIGADVIRHRVPIDPHARCAVAILRAPGSKGITASRWDLRLFSSDDGRTPHAVLSSPLFVEITWAAPDPPGIAIQKDRTHDSITISWAAPIHDGGAPVESYDLAVWDWSIANSSIGAKADDAVWQGSAVSNHLIQRIPRLKPNHSYVVRVRSVNKVAKSGWSCPSGEMTTAPALPGIPPTPIGCGISQEEVSLKWTADNSNLSREEGGILFYTVQVLPVNPLATVAVPSNLVRKPPSMSQQVCRDATPSATVSGLCSNTKYQFQIRAHNVSGFGPWSNLSTPIVTKQGPPQAPPAPSVRVVERTRFMLEWEPPFNDGGYAVTGYLLRAEPDSSEYGTTVPAVEESVTSSPSWVNGLRGNTRYAVRIAAKNPVGTSQFSAESAFARTAPIAPKPPVTARAIDTQEHMLTIQWEYPSGDGGAGVVRYHVTMFEMNNRSDTECHNSAEAGDGLLSMVFDGLRGNTDYAFIIRAENNIGISDSSERFILKTGPSLPSAPKLPPRLAREALKSELLLEWDTPYDGGSQILNYEVLVAAISAATSTVDAGVPDFEGSAPQSTPAQPAPQVPLRNSQSVTSVKRVMASECRAAVGDLAPSSAYRVAVRAQTAKGWSPLSKWSAAFRTADAPPAQPSPPWLVGATSESISVEWDPPESSPQTVEYEVWCGKTADLTKGRMQQGRRNRTTRSTLRVTNLAQNTKYFFRVRARNWGGWSAWSRPSDPYNTSDVYSTDEVKTALLRAHKGTIASLFRALDRDGDGSITRDEFVMGLDGIGAGNVVPITQRSQIFDILSGSRSGGRLTYREFAQQFSPYKATPAIARQMIPSDLPESQRKELHEELFRGRRTTPRVGQAVERLTTPRVSARGSARGSILRSSASEQRLSTLPERSLVSPNFPYPEMRHEEVAARLARQSSEMSLASDIEANSEPSLICAVDCGIDSADDLSSRQPIADGADAGRPSLSRGLACAASAPSLESVSM